MHLGGQTRSKSMKGFHSVSVKKEKTFDLLGMLIDRSKETGENQENRRIKFTTTRIQLGVPRQKKRVRSIL